MILHVITHDKFIPEFIKFMDDNFDASHHEYFIFGDTTKYPIRACNSKMTLRERFGMSLEGLKTLLLLTRKLHSAEKIILHGLWNGRVIQTLWSMPWLLRKCYWIIWGGDLYRYKFVDKTKDWHRLEFFRRSVIRKIGNLVTYLDGDVALAREWYSANGRCHYSLMYPSNTFSLTANDSPRRGLSTVLVGNSADPTNNHQKIFRLLASEKLKHVKIYCPLAYGCSENASRVAAEGTRLFGTRFIPLLDMQGLERYYELLSTIDLAVFAHKRQQAMGNTIQLLGQGTTVYLETETSQWKLFNNLKIAVRDINHLGNPKMLEERERASNIELVKDFFSLENLKSQYAQIFNS
jgi:dTDP-N-acetylfucosamine:lipid II N-acetylfucosaminyltransferase